MQQIKFMAWDKRLKRMFPNDYLTEAGRQLVIFAQRMRPNLPDIQNAKGGILLPTDDDNMVFMQFTGLLDKRRKEIYSGHIVKQFDDICIIEPCVGGFDCRMIIGPHKGSTFRFEFLNPDYCEIIGNVYEDLDLIK